MGFPQGYQHPLKRKHEATLRKPGLSYYKNSILHETATTEFALARLLALNNYLAIQIELGDINNLNIGEISQANKIVFGGNHHFIIYFR